MIFKHLSYRLYTNKESLLIALLCVAALPFAQGGELLGGLAVSLIGCAPLVFALILPMNAGLGFTPLLGGVGVLIADFIVGANTGVMGPAMGIVLATAIALALGRLSGCMEALARTEDRGLAPLSSLVIGCLFLGLAMLLPSGGLDFAALSLVFASLLALACVRVLLAAVVAAVFVFMLVQSARKTPVPFPALAAVLLLSGIGMALTFLPPIERILMQDSYSLYSLLLFICGATAPFQIMKRLLIVLVYKRPYSLMRGLGACLLAAVVFLYCCLPYNDAMLEGIVLPAAPLLLAGCMLAVAAAAHHFMARRSPLTSGENARPRPKARARASALAAAAAVPAYILLALNAGALPQAPQLAQHTLYAMAAVLFGGAGRDGARAGRAALGALLFYTLQAAAPLACASLFGGAGIGEGFVHLLALVIITAAAVKQRRMRFSDASALTIHPPSRF